MEKNFESLSKRNEHNYKLYSNNDGYDLLIFDYKCGYSEAYIKYPKNDYFIELAGGYGFSNGYKKKFNLKDVWSEDQYESKISIYLDREIVCLVINSIDFQFLKLVGNNKTNERSIKCILGEKMSLNYLSLPSDIREIGFLFRTINDNVVPFYVIVDYPKYLHNYGDYRFRLVGIDNKIEEYKIASHQAYRDGGTTYITALAPNGDEYKLFVPTSFNYDENVKPPILEFIEKHVVCNISNKLEQLESSTNFILTKSISDDERDKLVKILDMELAPKFDK